MSKTMFIGHGGGVQGGEHLINVLFQICPSGHLGSSHFLVTLLKTGVKGTHEHVSFSLK
jgi:hypothetical protein